MGTYTKTGCDLEYDTNGGLMIHDVHLNHPKLVLSRTPSKQAALSYGH